MTKKVMAIEVMDVVVSFVITRLRLNLLFACPNFPSIVFRKRSSSSACFLASLLRFLGVLPKGEALEGRRQKERFSSTFSLKVQALSFRTDGVPTHLEFNSRWNVALAHTRVWWESKRPSLQATFCPLPYNFCLLLTDKF